MYKNHENKNELLKVHESSTLNESSTLKHDIIRNQQLKLDMEQQTGPKQEKEYIKAVYCHPAYLTSMQSTS